MLVAEYETDGSMKFITGEDLWNLAYRDKISERYVPRNWIYEALQEALQSSSYRGDFDELEVEGFLRERFTEMQAYVISH